MSLQAQARAALADVLAQVDPNVPVHLAMPSQLSAPCAVIQVQSGEPESFGFSWRLTFVVLVIGTSADNEAAVDLVEEWIEQAASALRGTYFTAVRWDQPSTRQDGFGSYPVVAMTVTTAVTSE